MLGIFKSLGNSTGKLLSKPLGNFKLFKTLGMFKGLEFEEARNLCGGLLPLFLPEGVEAPEAAESSFRRCHRLRNRYLLEGGGFGWVGADIHHIQPPIPETLEQPI